MGAAQISTMVDTKISNMVDTYREGVGKYNCYIFTLYANCIVRHPYRNIDYVKFRKKYFALKFVLLLRRLARECVFNINIK
jgi:hypothetical protein